MKIIFLDIDGVLNGQDTEYKGICPKRIRLLNDIIRRTRANVVITSAWRRAQTMQQLRRTFRERGCIGKIVGRTPDLEGSFSETRRGDEIKAWLDKASWMVHEFVILDDEDDLLPEQLPHFVRTINKIGLSGIDVVQAVNILNGANGD